MGDVGSLTYEELLSELHALIGHVVEVTVHGWNARRDERRLVAILGGRLAAGYAADFSAIAAELPPGESVLFAVKPDGAQERPPTFFVIARADFQGAARREPGPGVGFAVGDAFVAVAPPTA
jgi:hypothetical protein